MAINLLNFGSRRNELYLLVGQYAAVDRYLPSQILLAVYVTQQMQVSDQEEAVTIHAIPKATELLLIKRQRYVFENRSSGYLQLLLRSTVINPYECKTNSR